MSIGFLHKKTGPPVEKRARAGKVLTVSVSVALDTEPHPLPREHDAIESANDATSEGEIGPSFSCDSHINPK